MPSRNRVDAFIAHVRSGDHMGAIADYYCEDASMQENLADPRRGREALLGHEQQALDRLAAMETHPPLAVLVDGDHVAIHWVFDAVDKTGVRRRLTEIALQRWRGDRIAEERFFYDSATAWRIVADERGGETRA